MGSPLKLQRLVLCILIGWMVITGCSASSDPAAGAVQKYLQSMISADSSQMSKLVCKDFEDQAAKDNDSFAGVKAELNNAACKKTGTDGSSALVTCTGKIVATYGNEKQEIDLAGPVYRVTQEGGSWLVCGRQ